MFYLVLILQGGKIKLVNKQDCKSSSPEFHFFLSYSNLGKYFKVKNAGKQIPMQ